MDRQRSIGFGALFLIVAAIAFLWTRIPSEAPAPAATATPIPPAPTPSVSAAPAESAAPSLESAVESALSPEDGAAAGFDILPDGRKAPPLPGSAPQQVTFGVVVFA